MEQSAARLTANRAGLLSHEKAAANRSSALNSVPVQQLKLVKCLVSCKKINPCLSGRVSHMREMFYCDCLCTASQSW